MRVIPGTIATFSTPAITSTGHSASRNCAARMVVPTDTSGATRLAANATPKCPMNTLEPELDAARGERRRGAARRVALHVHGDRIHRDVRGRDLDVHRERGRVAAEALRPHAEPVHRLAEA